MIEPTDDPRPRPGGSQRRAEPVERKQAGNRFQRAGRRQRAVDALAGDERAAEGIADRPGHGPAQPGSRNQRSFVAAAQRWSRRRTDAPHIRPRRRGNRRQSGGEKRTPPHAVPRAMQRCRAPGPPATPMDRYGGAVCHPPSRRRAGTSRAVGRPALTSASHPALNRAPAPAAPRPGARRESRWKKGCSSARRSIPRRATCARRDCAPPTAAGARGP